MTNMTTIRLHTPLLRRLSTALAVVALATLAACAGNQRTEATGEYVDDTVITTKVKAAVFNEASLKSAEINVETFKGRVQLSGFVSSQADINRAVALAREVKGVSTVANDLRLK